MSVISEEDVNLKNEEKFSLKLKEISESSNNSHNDEEILFSPNYLLMQSNSNSICKTNPNQINNKNLIFDSMDMDFKKKLFSSENNQNNDNKKYNETKSTDPASIKTLRVKNLNSPTKRYSMIKLIEKDKKNKKEQSKFAIKTEEMETVPEKKERVDIFGNVINKKNKKRVKVSFVDKVTSQPLVNVIEIENFKKYNYIIGMPNEKIIDKSANCKCCIMF